MGREGGFHFTISWDEELDAEITSNGMDGTGGGKKKRKTFKFTAFYNCNVNCNVF